MNPFLAQLDRRLARRGELIDVRRQVNAGSTNTFVMARVPAIVRALTVEQLIGSITQQNFFIIISPSHLARQQWPGGKTPAATGSIIQPSDPRLPTTNDWVWIRGSTRIVQRVAPVFDAGECVRIELSVIG